MPDATSASKAEELIVLDHATIDVPGRAERLVGPVSLSVAQGEVVALIGPSGVGKSLILKALAGLVQTSGGRRTVASGMALRIGIALQSHALLAWRDLISNIALPSQLGMSHTTGLAYALELSKLMGLEGREALFPHQLSGGMKSRASIARALMSRPHLLLLDEPFGDLDEVTAGKLIGDLVRVVRREGASVVVVSHNLRQAAMMADRFFVLGGRPGRVTAELPGAAPADRERALAGEACASIDDAAVAVRAKLKEATA